MSSTARRAITLVDLHHTLIECQWSNRTYDATEDFLLFSFGGVLAETFAKKPKDSSSAVLPRWRSAKGLFDFFKRWFNLAKPANKTKFRDTF